jgi:hypothetical protein
MLLPIAIRELRVSARNKATHRLRLYFAVGAVAVGGGIGLLFSMGGGLAGSQAGILIFGALKWIAFVFACAAGVRHFLLFRHSSCHAYDERLPLAFARRDPIDMDRREFGPHCLGPPPGAGCLFQVVESGCGLKMNET